LGKIDKGSEILRNMKVTSSKQHSVLTSINSLNFQISDAKSLSV